MECQAGGRAQLEYRVRAACAAWRLRRGWHVRRCVVANATAFCGCARVRVAPGRAVAFMAATATFVAVTFLPVCRWCTVYGGAALAAASPIASEALRGQLVIYPAVLLL